MDIITMHLVFHEYIYGRREEEFYDFICFYDMAIFAPPSDLDP